MDKRVIWNMIQLSINGLIKIEDAAEISEMSVGEFEKLVEKEKEKMKKKS